MNSDERTSDQFFTPFYPHSVNIVSAPSNAGKSTLLQNIIKNKKNCFTRDFNRIVVVFCNDKVNSLPYDNLQSESLNIESCYLQDFSTQDLLPNDLVIFEDVLKITSDIQETIKVLAHHIDLASVFVVVQCVYNDEFKVLLSISHQIIIFLNGTQGTKLAQQLKQYFFINSEIKEKLKEIISEGEKYKDIVLLKLNNIARKDEPYFFSITGLNNFVENFNYSVRTFIFPQLYFESLYQNMFNDNYAELDIDPATIPKGSFILVPAANVKRKTQVETTSEKNIKEKNWETLTNLLANEIETGVLNYKRQKFAINIAKYMLSSNKFSFSKDGRAVMITNEPKTLVSVVDYLDTASRAAGPNEMTNPIFLKFTKILLDARMPKIFVKNKNLLYGFKNNKRDIHQLYKRRNRQEIYHSF
jgi:hypothetical protein